MTGTMFDWTSDLGVISFGSGAWWLGDEGDNMTLVVSEASNTCDIISQLADGTYSDAAFMVNLVGWSGPATGTFDMDSTDPILNATAYIELDDSGAGIGLGGDESWMIIGVIEPGGMLEYTVNLDEDFDVSRGAEGSGNACYCTAAEGLSFPLGGGIGDEGPPLDEGPPPDEPPPFGEGPPDL